MNDWERIHKLDTSMINLPVVTGVVHGDPDSWYETIILDIREIKDMSNENILSRLGWYESYAGPGRYFCSAGYIRRSGKSIIVSRRCGYDY